MSNVTRVLDAIERAGNRLPHPTVLFLWFAAAVLVLSWLLHQFGAGAVHPVTQDPIAVVNLLSAEGLRRVLLGTVSNFTGFAPLGTVLVAMLGIGIAEQSGLLGALLRRLVTAAPARLLTSFVVLAGVLSSLAADAGYVVLIPLAAIVFKSAGRHPLAGITAAFAGVSGGFSANLLIGPLDAILAGLSTSAAGLIAPDITVSAAGNYYFIIASTFLITILGTLVTEVLVEPRLTGGVGEFDDAKGEGSDPNERKALIATAAAAALLVAALLWATIPHNALLRDPVTGTLVPSPLISSSVVLVTLFVAICGLVYGWMTGNFRGEHGPVRAMETTMSTMAGYLVLMFFAAQFVAWFGWTNLGLILAIRGSEALSGLNASPIAILILFVLLAASINLLIGSASAKWAIMAPVFVPMLMLLGISPEATQMSYRIGDSVSNIVTPLMPYLALVVAVAQQYDRRIGVGTLIAHMLPYSVAFLVGWTILLTVWMLGDWPLGPGATFEFSAS